MFFYKLEIHKIPFSLYVHVMYNKKKIGKASRGGSCQKYEQTSQQRVGKSYTKREKFPCAQHCRPGLCCTRQDWVELKFQADFFPFIYYKYRLVKMNALFIIPTPGYFLRHLRCTDTTKGTSARHGR